MATRLEDIIPKDEEEATSLEIMKGIAEEINKDQTQMAKARIQRQEMEVVRTHPFVKRKQEEMDRWFNAKANKT